MKRNWLAIILAGILASCPQTVRAAPAQPLISADDWQAYKERFVDRGGRIIDGANGNISHSEGQGYGLLLSVLADSQPDFELIWAFTRTELLLRNDGLVAWKWSSGAKPHVTDINNATDGDILIAYALGLAGQRWGRADYLRAGSGIARAILKRVVVEDAGRTLLLPGASGFSAGERKDGPVINPSYWVFEAFPILEQLAPSPQWQKLRSDGVALMRSLRFGPRHLPADWVSMKALPAPASDFPAEFGYNALRIPLYLVRGGIEDRELLAHFQRGMADPDGKVLVVNLVSGAVKGRLNDPGYRIVNHILACVVNRSKLPADVRKFTPTLYYPSTLHLLGLSYVVARQPECL